MEVSFELLWEFTPGMLLTATFCYGSTAALRQVKILNEHKVFRSFLPLVPGFFGALLAVFVPFFWPPSATESARAVLGAVAGFNMGTLYDVVKRIIGMYNNKLDAKLSGGALPAPAPATPSADLGASGEVVPAPAPTDNPNPS